MTISCDFCSISINSVLNTGSEAPAHLLLLFDLLVLLHVFEHLADLGVFLSDCG